MAMFRIEVKKRARILSSAEFKRMLKVVSITREAERNQLALCMSYALGVRVTELAQITIRDILTPKGVIKNELTLCSNITKNSRMRVLPVSNKLLIKHLELYLTYRIEQQVGMDIHDSTEFRGLAPDRPLLFSNRGGGFSIVRKKRLLKTGVVEEYGACDPLVMRTINLVVSMLEIPFLFVFYKVK